MKKIRLGNDFLFIWAIVRNSQPEDLTIAESIELTLKSYDGSVEISNYDIVDTNKLAIQFTSSILDKTADYNLRLSYSIPDNTMDDGLRNCVVDIDCFSIVPKTALADEANEFAETSDIGVAFKGDDAYQVWLMEHEGTLQDYYDWLQKPATDAADLANEATGNANEAIKALETLNVEVSTAEDLRATAEQGRVSFYEQVVAWYNAAVTSISTALNNIATAIQNAVTATTNANNATTSANNAATNANAKATLATDATTLCNAAKTATENLNTSVTAAEGIRVTDENTRKADEVIRKANEVARVAAGYVTSPQFTQIVQLTQAQYDALTPKVATTLYIIIQA